MQCMHNLAVVSVYHYTAMLSSSLTAINIHHELFSQTLNEANCLKVITKVLATLKKMELKWLHLETFYENDPSIGMLAPF